MGDGERVLCKTERVKFAATAFESFRGDPHGIHVDPDDPARGHHRTEGDDYRKVDGRWELDISVPLPAPMENVWRLRRDPL